MKQCKRCGYQASDDLTICPVCSTPLESNYQSSSSIKKIFCSNCGEQIDSSYKYCPHCQALVNEEPSFQGQSSYQSNYNSYKPKGLPKHYKSSQVLGILSVVFMGIFFISGYGVDLIGLILGIIGLSLASSDKRNFQNYSKVGFITSLISVIIGAGLFILGLIIGFTGGY